MSATRTSSQITALITIAVISLRMSAWAEDAPLDAAINQLGVNGGWAVHVGTTDGSMEEALCELAPFAVTGIAFNTNNAAVARNHLLAQGLAGQATITETLDSSRLPFNERSVSMLVVDIDAVGQDAPSNDEIQRVLRPGGVAVVNNGGWHVLSRGPQQGTDDWTHFNGDVTGSDASNDELAGAPHSIRWEGADLWYDDKFGMRSAAGITVAIENNDIGRSHEKPSGRITARDAYNGAVLWQRDGLFVRSRYGLVVDDERVYLHAMQADHFVPSDNWRDPFNPNERPMISFDIRTGMDAVSYDEGIIGRTAPTGRRYTMETQADLMHALVHEGVLIQTMGGEVCALDATTGRQLWRHATPDNEYYFIPVIAGDRVIVIRGPRYDRSKMGYLLNTPAINASVITAYDLSSGDEVWASTPTGLDQSPVITRMTSTDTHVALMGYERFRNVGIEMFLIVLDAESGNQLWMNSSNSAGYRKVMAGGHFIRPQFHNDRVWATGAGGAVGFNTSDGSDALNRMANNFRCSTSRATPNWLMASQSFIDIQSGNAFFTEAFRGRCDFGVFPANGMVYSAMGPQCNCAAFLRSRAAYASERLPEEPWTGERLLRGNASISNIASDLDASGWPMWLHDGARSNWTETTVAAEPSIRWTRHLAKPNSGPQGRERNFHPYANAPITGATALGNTAVAALPDSNVVVGLDLTNGEERWRIIVDGRVDSPPTLYRGAAFFGTRSGFTYAINLLTGELIWRRLIAPHQNMILAHGQAESTWPVFGSLLVHDGLVWATAGRQAELDHGLRWYAFDPATGDVKRQGRIAEQSEWHEDFQTPRIRATNGPMITDGTNIIYWRGGFVAESGENIRFAGTIKSYRGGTDQNGEWNRCLLPSVRWGMHFADHGTSYGGLVGNNIVFNGDTVFQHFQPNTNAHRLARQTVNIWQKAERSGDQQNGSYHTQVWETTVQSAHRTKNARHCQAMVHAGGYLLIGSIGGLEVKDAETGKTLSITELPSNVIPHGISVAANGHILVACEDGNLVCLE